MTGFAWTPGSGAYKHYPHYVNLTGNRLTVRGVEDLSGPYPQMGATVSIDLPDDELVHLASAIEARRAAAGNTDAVHESATGNAGDAQS